MPYNVLQLLSMALKLLKLAYNGLTLLKIATLSLMTCFNEISIQNRVLRLKITNTKKRLTIV